MQKRRRGVNLICEIRNRPEFDVSSADYDIFKCFRQCRLIDFRNKFIIFHSIKMRGTTISTRQHCSPHPRGCYFSLACSIGSVGIACGSLLQLNSTSDRISVQRGFFLMSLGFIYFVTMTEFFNKYLLETQNGIRIRKKYRLMVSDVMDITNKIVSAIQAAFSCIAGFIACKSSCSKSFLYASHFVMEAYAWFGTAYFMYDIWSMYAVHAHKIADKLKLKNISSRGKNMNLNRTTNGLYDKHNTAKTNKMIRNDKNHLKHYQDEVDYGENVDMPRCGRWGFLKYIISHPVMVMHHIFIGTFGLLVVTYLRGGTGDCVYSFIYLMEFSTPFVSLRSILSTMGLKSSRMYVVNGILMLITFFICRIVMWPYVFYWYSNVINRTFVQAIMGLPRNCKIGIMILFLPQIYWFYLMLRGALKVIFAPKKCVKIERDVIKLNQKDNLTSTVRNTTRDHREPDQNNIKRSASPAKELNNSKKVVHGRSLL